MRINFGCSKNFVVTKLQVQSKKMVGKQEELGAQKNETQNGVEASSDTKPKRIDSKGLTANYVNTAKESAEKIKSLTEELKSLKLPKNPTQEDVYNFVAYINALRQQANELYDTLFSSNVKTKCKEYDEFYHALMDFNKLVEVKLTQAEIQSNTLRGVMSRALDNKLRTLA